MILDQKLRYDLIFAEYRTLSIINSRNIAIGQKRDGKKCLQNPINPAGYTIISIEKEKLYITGVIVPKVKSLN